MKLPVDVAPSENVHAAAVVLDGLAVDPVLLLEPPPLVVVPVLVPPDWPPPALLLPLPPF